MIEMFESLPADRQEALASWFALQRLIAQETDTPLDEWFRLIQEALEHPLDYSFIEGTKPGSAEPVETEKIDGARRMLGTSTAKGALEGVGIVEASKKGGLEQELLQRFRAQQMDFDSARAPRKGRRR
jgi:hypothetical protein